MLIGMGTEDRRGMGEQGRAHVRAHFSLERMCASTIDLYRGLVLERHHL
jgi:glycosyltransferase involved in cell wall biosynthesis